MNPEDIRALRASYCLTREELAKAIGVTKQTLYFWEKGTYKPSRYDAVVLRELWKITQNTKKKVFMKKVLHKIKKTENYDAEGSKLLFLLSNLFCINWKTKKIEVRK